VKQKWPPRANRHIVMRDMLKIMKKSMLVVDISCDPAGAIETCVPTSHDKPTYEVEEIKHFCVENLPSAVARKSSYSLCNTRLPLLCTSGPRWDRGIGKSNRLLG